MLASVVLSYVLPVLLANKPLNKMIFRKYFKLLFVILLLICSLFFIFPNGPEYYYYEVISVFMVIVVGSLFYVSARRYREIGGSRWNIFTAFFHFPEFMRLWWEDPVEQAPENGSDK